MMAAMGKTKVLLATFSNPFFNWLPYPVGCLISYARKNPRIEENYEFLTPLFEPIDYHESIFKGVEILGLTNYVWNQGFNDKLSQRFRAYNPKGKIIYGGPNVPENEEDAKEYKKIRPFVDIFFMGPGEESFESFLLSLLDGKRADFPGTFGPHWQGQRLSRKDYDMSDPPAPYVDGLFDSWLAKHDSLGMIIETNRGCPFRCSFCDWGSMTRARIHKFELAKVLESIEKMLRHSNIQRLYIADANFGFFPEDLEIIKFIAQMKKKLKRHFYIVFCAY